VIPAAVSVEMRLREKVDALRFELDCRDARIEDLHARLARENPALPAGRCGYCGDRCYGPACVLHRDLLLVDTEVPA
jgi:hypothetical protein